MSSPLRSTGIDAAYIIDTAQEAFVQLDEDGRILEWNRAAEKMFGWTREEALDLEVAELIIVPEEREQFRFRLRRRHSAGPGPSSSRRVERHAIHRDGHRLVVEYTVGSAVHGANGRTFVHAFIRDITDRARAELIHRTQLQVGRALAVANPDDAPQLVLEAVGSAGGWTYGGWWEADDTSDHLHRHRSWARDGTDVSGLILMNRDMRFTRGKGLPGRAWQAGHSVWVTDLARQADWPRALVAEQVGLHAGLAVPLLSGGHVVAVIEFLRDTPGPRDDDAVELVRGTTSLVGEYVGRTRAERRATELQEAFVATASHELRTPLTAITGFTRTLLDLRLDQDQQREFLGIILDQAGRLSRLVDDLLDMSRLQAGVVESTRDTFDLAALVRDTAAERRVLDDAAQHVEIIPASGEVLVYADRDTCHQILVNLLDNADKYAGGATSIELRSVDGCVQLRVSDDGPGVPEEFRSRLFHRFARASDEADVPGSGLGLSIVRAFAQLQGGDAWFEPNQPRGSTFVVSICQSPSAG